MRLIGLNGFKTAGKDTTCDIIKELHDNVERAGFADKLKIMAAKAVGFLAANDQQCIKFMNECKEEWKFNIFTSKAETIAQFSGREYLQWFGGEARGVFGDTFWIDQVLPNPQFAQPWNPKNSAQYWDSKHLEARYPNAEILCITDVRYENEGQRILDLGGEIWEVLRPGLESDGHGSEIPLPRAMVTWQVSNDGTIDDLRNTVKQLV